MSWRTPTLLTFLLFLLFPLAASLNITRIFGRFPEFTTFNNLLSQTQLASDINSRNTLTVLAVSNDAIMSVAGRSIDDLRKILAVHVLLDYFDEAKILQRRSAFVTTLFQTSGLAMGQNGFLNVTNTASGQITFGSAEDGSPPSANFIKEVMTRPYNISVLQVSGVIFPPQMGGGPQTHTSPPAPPTDANSSAPGPSLGAGSPSKAPAPSGGAGSPSNAPTASKDAPSKAPSASGDSGSPSNAPAASGDGGSPSKAPGASGGAGPSASKAPAGSKDAGPSPSEGPAASKDAGTSPSKAPPAPHAPKAHSPPADGSPPSDSADGPTEDDDDDDSDDKNSATRRAVVGAGVAGAVAFAMLALP